MMFFFLFFSLIRGCFLLCQEGVLLFAEGVLLFTEGFSFLFTEGVLLLFTEEKKEEKVATSSPR